jgi:hypothetical protein
MNVKEALLQYFGLVIENPKIAGVPQLSGPLSEIFDRDAQQIGRRRRIVVSNNTDSLR